MYVLTEIGYVLICQVKEKEKNNVFLKMLLWRRAKSQQEIKTDYSKDYNYLQFKWSSSRICLVTLSKHSVS